MTFPVETPPSVETPTSIETMHDLEHQINELKKKKDALKVEIQQKKLNQTEQTKKQTEIDQKVSEIQTKLQAVEAQTEEERLNKERLSNELMSIQTDLATLANEVVNGASATLLASQVSAEVIEKEVINENNVNNEKEEQKKEEQKKTEDKNLFQKSWGWLKEQGEAATSKAEWKEHPRKNVARVAGGIGAGVLVYKGIKKLRNWAFGDKDNKKAEGKEEKKGEKTSWRKKALKRVGIGVGGTWLGRGFITGNRDLFGRNPFKKKAPGDGKETIPGTNVHSRAKEFLKLPEVEQTTYNSLAEQINTYYGNAMGDMGGVQGIEDMLGDSDFEKKDGKNSMGVVPFILNNRYANIGAMLKEKAFFYEILGTEGNIFWNKLKDWGVDGLKALCTPLAGLVDGMTSWLVDLDATGNVNVFLDKLKQAPNMEETLRTVFRKSISVISYYQSRKRKLDYQLALQYLEQHESGFSSFDEKKKQRKIRDYLSDGERYDKHIKSGVEAFLGKTLYTSVEYMQKPDIAIFDGEVDPLIEESMEMVEERKNDCLEIDDEDDESVVFDIKAEIKEGKLTPKGKEKLQNLCEDWEEEIDSFGKDARYNRYLPILSMFDINASDTMEKLQRTGDYEEVVKSYKDKIQEILKKSSDGTLREADLDELEIQINDYYKFEKSLTVSALNVSESRDENGDIVATWISTFYKSGETFVNGIKATGKGDWLKGGAMILGGGISLDIITYPIRRGAGIIRHGKVGNILPPTVRPLWKGLKYLGKKTGMQIGRMNADWLPARIAQAFHNEHTLRVAFARGEVSLESARKIAQQKGRKVGTTGNPRVIANADDYLEFLFGRRADLGEIKTLLTKYGDNPKMYKQLFSLKYQNRKLLHPKDWFKLDKSKLLLDIDVMHLQKLKDLDKIISTVGTTEKQRFWTILLKNTKNLDNVEALMKTQALQYTDDVMKQLSSIRSVVASTSVQNVSTLSKSYERLYQLGDGVDDITRKILHQRNIADNANYFVNTQKIAEAKAMAQEMIKTNPIATAKNLGKYLAKYMTNIDTAGIQSLEKFFLEASSQGKIGNNAGLFVRNSLRNFEKVKASGFDITKIDDLKLNTSKWTRIAEATKKNTKKMIDSLGKMAKNPRFKPFRNTIQKQTTAFTEYVKTITPEGMKAIKNMSWLDNISGFSKLSTEGIHELSRLSYLLRDVDKGADILKALKGATKVDDVKTILAGKGIVVNHIDDAVLMKLAKTKNLTKLQDIINYGAEFKSVQGLKKLITNPTMKYAGKVLGKALVVADFALVGRTFSSNYSEAQKIKLNNETRGERKEDQAYFELTTGGLGAVAGACMFIPGAGWIAAGALGVIIGVQAIGNKYYDDIEKFKQNYEDFLKKSLPAVKQELVSVQGWKQGIGKTRIDAIIPSSAEQKRLGIQPTTEGAVKALIFKEECQNFPYASFSLDDKQVKADDELFTLVKQHQDAVDARMEKRLTYIQENYINQNKPLVDKQQYETSSAVGALDKLLRESRVALVVNDDTSYTDKQNVLGYSGFLKRKLETENAEMFTKLEEIFATQPTKLFLLYAQLPSYKKMLVEHPFEGEENTNLSNNVMFFAEYMVYKTLGKLSAEFPPIDFEPEKIDYNPLHELLTSFTISPKTMEASELAERAEFLDNKAFCLRYGVSVNLGQNILYEFAKAHLGYGSSPNDMKQLQQFYHESQKETYGIYYNVDKDTRYINENNGPDNAFAKTNELNEMKKIQILQKEVQDANAEGFMTGKMFTEGDNNKEYTNNLLGIINHNVEIRTNAKQIRAKILDRINQHTSGENYVELPLDLLKEGTKAGIANLASAVYRIKDGKIEYKSGIQGVKPGL